MSQVSQLFWQDTIPSRRECVPVRVQTAFPRLVYCWQITSLEANSW